MSFGIWELLIVLIIVALLFGTKKLSTMGSDLGSALKGFRSALKDEDSGGAQIINEAGDKAESGVIEGEVDTREDKV